MVTTTFTEVQVRTLAEAMHGVECTFNHIDQCAYGYQGINGTGYVRAARKLLEADTGFGVDALITAYATVWAVQLMTAKEV